MKEILKKLMTKENLKYFQREGSITLTKASPEELKKLMS